MQIQIPWGLVAIFISLSLFYYYSQKSKIRREQRRERLKDKQQDILDALARKNENNDLNAESKS